jgi:hypothetical protein
MPSSFWRRRLERTLALVTSKICTTAKTGSSYRGALSALFA